MTYFLRAGQRQEIRARPHGTPGTYSQKIGLSRNFATDTGFRDRAGADQSILDIRRGCA